MLRQLRRDAGAFGVFMFWTFAALIAGMAVLGFLAQRFNSGMLAPVGAAASFIERKAVGS